MASHPVGPAHSETRAFTPNVLRDQLEALATGGSDVDPTELATAIRTWFELRAGPQPKLDELTVAWAVEVTAARPQVMADDGSFTLPLGRIGNSDVHAAVATLPWGTAMRWHYEVGDGSRRTLTPPLDDSFSVMYPAGGAPLEVYTTHPDSVQPGVPTGTPPAWSERWICWPSWCSGPWSSSATSSSFIPLQPNRACHYNGRIFGSCGISVGPFTGFVGRAMVDTGRRG
jgi:hypothetical protein